MKKFLFIAAAALAMVSCSKDSEVIPSVENGKQNAIGFKVTKQNMGRAANDMQNTHYNFGVFAHKSVTAPAVSKIMEDYLVGYFDNVNKVGYNPTSAQTTVGGTTGNLTDLLSLWSYEGLGTSEYAWASNTTEHYYTTSASDSRYMSNYAKQYLRYFDYSAATTDFYAYAPYINKSALSLASQVTFDNTTKKMEFPANSLEAGYDDPTKYEYLFSYAHVDKEDYDEDVQMSFRHLNSRIRIVFYEDIAGYNVTMKDLDANAGIIAVPANFDGTSTYTYANNTLANKAQVIVEFDKYNEALDNFNNGPVKLPVGNSFLAATAGDAINSNITEKALVFNTPNAETLSENRNTAVNSDPLTGGYYSATTYYGIPNNGTFGLTFRVSFKLTSTTGETINVYNAGVYVANTYCAWKPGKQYTYVFKITKNTNGSTDSDDATATVDPTPGDKALYPIVFDGLTIEDWGTAVEHEQPIN